MANSMSARVAGLPEDYEKLGLTKNIAQWEDGLRTTGKKGEYEWWYFDFKLDGGATLVIVFYTASIMKAADGFAPRCSFTLIHPEQGRIADNVSATMENAAFSKDGCNVKIGNCTASGDLNHYTVHWESGKLTADITLTGRIASWRPETGHLTFDDGHYFAWIPAVPEGEAKVTYTVDGVTTTLSGSGYHDHNWGDIAMFHLMHHWYWGRAQVGSYQVISSYITGRKKYGYAHFPVFMLAKDGVLLGDDYRKVRFTQLEPTLEPHNGKHYHKTIVFDYEDGDTHYRVSYLQEGFATENKGKRNKLKDLAARAATGVWDLEPAYLRLTGTCRIEKLENGQVVETEEAPALWELMYFGKDAEV